MKKRVEWAVCGAATYRPLDIKRCEARKLADERESVRGKCSGAPCEYQGCMQKKERGILCHITSFYVLSSSPSSGISLSPSIPMGIFCKVGGGENSRPVQAGLRCVSLSGIRNR